MVGAGENNCRIQRMAGSPYSHPVDAISCEEGLVAFHEFC